MHAWETLRMLQRGKVGEGQFICRLSVFNFLNCNPGVTPSMENSKLVGIQLANVLVFFRCIQASIFDQPLGQLAFLSTPYRFVDQRVQVKAHVE